MRGVVVATLLLGCTTSRSGIDGRLLVHTGDPTPWTSVHVLLGDGSVYDVAVDGNGDALFEDHAIRGPQEVTVVRVEAAAVHVLTANAIDHEEMWARFFGAASLPGLGTVSGKVLGASVPTNVQVQAYGATLFGFGRATTAGTYALTFTGSTQGAFDLVAFEDAPQTAQSGQPVLLRAGAVRHLASAPMIASDITLDHEADQPIAIDVRGADAYAPMFEYQVGHTLDGFDLFENSLSSSMPSATVMTIAATTPFDGLSRTATVIVGDFSPPNGGATVAMPLDSNAITIDLPAPQRLVSPTLETSAPPTVPVPLSGLDFIWTMDRTMQYASLELRQQKQTGETLYWEIVSPSSQTEFSPFVLPSDASSLTLGPDAAAIGLFTIHNDEVSSYEDLWGMTPHMIDYLGGTFRQTAVIGNVLLQ